MNISMSYCGPEALPCTMESCGNVYRMGKPGHEND
jgi:hypothetical protein